MGTASDAPIVVPLGDSAVTVRFGEEIHERVHARVMAFAATASAAPREGILECVPAYATVTVFYDPLRLTYAEIVKWVSGLPQSVPMRHESRGRVMEIPVCYGGDYGPDLQEVAAYHGMSGDEIIRLHTQPNYRVYMLGFVPGFPYLGGLPPELATPRRDVPRTSIPAGSVGIGGGQTGIYPLTSPGGWQLIGRTPLPLFMPEASPPTRLQAGDAVRFVSVTKEEFESLQGKWIT